MGCVGLIDITVGNAARLGASQRTCSRAIAPASSEISECRQHPITQSSGRTHSPASKFGPMSSWGPPGLQLPAKAIEINLAIG